MNNHIFLLVSAGFVLDAISGTTASAQSLAERRSADLDILRNEVVLIDASFDEAKRTEALALIRQLEDGLGELSEAEYRLALAYIVAQSGNGHSQLLPSGWRLQFDSMPVRFLIADDGLMIADAAPDMESLVGRPVQSVCGQSLDQLREVWSRYTTGRQGFQDESLPVLLETPELLEAAGVCVGVPVLEFEGRDLLEIGARAASFPEPEGVWQYFPQSRLIELVQRGRIAEPPLYLQEPEQFFRMINLSEHDAVYLQFRANVDFSGETELASLAQQAIETLRETSPRFVIVDQRFNFGGDLNNTRDLMQAIPEIVGENGRVFAITSGRTFSAGISSLGYLEQAGGARVVIVGAPIGDHLEFWAEGEVVTFPAAEANILTATERHNYMTGCPETDCHGSIRENPIAVPSLDPDISPLATGAALMAGRDPYLEAVFTAISEE